MATALALHSHSIAEELYEILRELDPAAWRDDIQDAARARLQLIQIRLDALLEGTEPALNHPQVIQLRERIREISHLIDQRMPDHHVPVEQIQDAWNDFRLAVLPRYEKLVASLRTFDIHVPSLRPTNYTRNLFHVLNGLLAISIVMVIADMRIMMYIGAAFTTLGWTLEATRRLSKRWNTLLMKVFSPVAHPHEAWRVNSATWFCTALLSLALLNNMLVGVLGLIVLAFADPAAAMVGRRWGRIRLVHGRTLEGTLTFIVVGIIVASALLALAWPDLSWSVRLILAGSAAIGGGLAELFSRRIDDNLAVPVSAALTALAASALLGL